MNQDSDLTNYPTVGRENRRIPAVPRLSASVWIAIGFLVLDSIVLGDAVWFEMLTGLLGGLRWTRLEDVMGPMRWPSSADALTMALASSQTGLLVIWALLGSHRWPLRWLGAAAGTSLWIAALAVIPTRIYKPALTEALFAGQAATIAVLVLATCVMMRSTGNASDKRPSGRPQFRLADMFLGLTGISLLLALLPAMSWANTYALLRGVLQGSSTWGGSPGAETTFIWLLIHGAGCGLLASLTVWAILGRGAVGPRMAISLVAAWALSRLVIKSYFDYWIYVELWHGYRQKDLSPYALWLCAHVGLIAIALRASHWGHVQRTSRATTAGVDARPARRPWLKAVAFTLVALGAVRCENTISLVFCDREHRRTIDTMYDLGIFPLRSSRPCVSPLWANCNRNLRPQEIDRLCGLAKVEGICFAEGTLRPETWDRLQRMPQLRFVSVAGATDDDLARLAKLSGVDTIDVSGAGITDAGLAHLLALPKLKFLRLNNTPQVTPQGLAPLSKRARIDLVN